MLVLAAFLSIGAFFVAFLLRFTFALQSEAQLQAERAVWAKRLRGRRVPSSLEARSSAMGLNLAYSNPKMTPARQGSLGARLAVEDASRVKKEA
jgi:hypothetical protein